MPNSETPITPLPEAPKKSNINPEAIEMMNKIKSGEYLRQIKAKIAPYRWYITGAAVLILLLLAISIGRAISRKNAPGYVPPVIDVVQPTTEVKKSSRFDSLKRSIQIFSTTLPDPAIPFFDNNINLEKTL